MARIMWRIRNTDFEEPWCGTWLVAFNEHTQHGPRTVWSPNYKDAMLFFDEAEAMQWLHEVERWGHDAKTEPCLPGGGSA